MKSGPKFDKGKPFYPLVMHYLTLLVGFKELAVRGVLGKPSLDAALEKIGGIKDAPASQIDELRKDLSKLLGPLELKSEFSGDHVIFDIDEVSREIAQNSSYLAEFLMQAAASVLVLAHELSKDRPWHDSGPLWEFLRHCRNAAAHGGSISFKGGEPHRLAQWGCLVFVSTLQGLPLFNAADRAGMLSPGDPIRLLYDIERAYPQMTAK
jgi:hypothetical protein